MLKACYNWVSKCNTGTRWERAWREVHEALTRALPLQTGLHEHPRLLTLVQHIDAMQVGANPDDIVRITILGTGNLSDEPDIIHPVVRVHLVDATSGRYLVGSQMANGAVTYYERASAIQVDSLQYSAGVDETNNLVGRVLPVATAPCHLKGHSIAPVWNESWLINMPFRELLNPNVLMLFEIVDFNHIQSHSTHREHTDGLYGLAWAYLKPISPRGHVYVGACASTTQSPSIVGKTAATSEDQTKLSIRLQLYDYKPLSSLARYQARIRGVSAPPAPASPHVPAVYLQYLSKHRTRYASTLLVRIHPALRPQDCEVNRRTISPNEREVSDMVSFASQPKFGTHLHDASKERAPDARSLRAVCRQRLGRECCILPDRLLCRINSGACGALTIQFSPTGRLLAVATVELLVHPIRLYDATGYTEGTFRDVPSAATASVSFELQADFGKEGAILLAELDGHHGMIYELCFTQDERFLLSASADGFAKVWDLGALAALPDATRPTRAPQVLCIFRESAMHYIYAASFVALASKPRTNQQMHDKIRFNREETNKHGGVPSSPHAFDAAMGSESIVTPCPPVLTGSYSGAIAYWDPVTCRSQGILGNVISHDGRVHCIEVDHRSGRVYSGDSAGVILVWRRNGHGGHVSHFSKIRKVEHPDLKCKPIMSMRLHPTHRRGQLLVQAQSSTLMLLDLATLKTVAQFKGNVVETSFIRAEFSPEGSIVMAGSEDGNVYAWYTRSTTPISLPVSHLGYTTPLCDLSWHPTQHVIAYTCYGGAHPVLLYFAHRPEVPSLLVESRVPGDTDRFDGDRTTRRKARLKELQARYKSLAGSSK